MDEWNRCHIQFLPLDDPEQAANSPALAALCRKGWRPIANFVAERGGRTELILLFAPPIESGTWRSLVPIMIACACGAVVGSAVAIAASIFIL